MSDTPVTRSEPTRLPPAGRHDRVAILAGFVAVVLLVGAMLAGSRNLTNFDVALLGYALGTIFLAFGVTYRTVVWAGSPAARRYLVRGWKALLVSPGKSVPPTEAARTIVSTLLLQRFIARRSTARWLAHQGLFWGVVTATMITFPLTFGWIHFRAVSGSESAYWIYVVGVRTAQIDALGIAGWLAFHGLNFSAVLVVGGGGWFLYHRWRQRGNNLSQLGRDLMPLIALLAISITGLSLTVSSALMGGFGYQPLALLHMFTVVLTLIWIPFGKFFHTVQRPAMIGVHLHKQASLDSGGVLLCPVCGAPVEGCVFMDDLQKTMGELGLDYGGWSQTCPTCKRITRGAQYREQVKAGF